MSSEDLLESCTYMDSSVSRSDFRFGSPWAHPDSSQREMSNAKSPLFSHFAAAVNGIVSIRAYGAQE